MLEIESIPPGGYALFGNVEPKDGRSNRTKFPPNNPSSPIIGHQLPRIPGKEVPKAPHALRR